jgi:dipeptidyl aminopeptidase/acylaminoacyl peptidase
MASSNDFQFIFIQAHPSVVGVCPAGIKTSKNLDWPALQETLMRYFISILMVLVAGIVPVTTHAQNSDTGKRPITFEDLMALKRIGGPQISPDGKWVLFTAVDVNLEANSKVPHQWIVPLAGGAARQLTTGVGEDRGQWSPDGKQIAFISARDGSGQVWAANFDSATGSLTGEPRKITSISTEADGEIWSPDGKSILFISEVYPDCAEDACNRKRDEERVNSKVKAMVFERLLYRHWSAYTRFKRSHLFVVPAAGGTATDITPGDHDVPPFSLGGQDMYAISPDSQEVAYTSNTDEVEAISTNNDIFVVPIGGGKARRLSTSPGSDSTPLYSPDGHYLAWRMQKRGGYESDCFNLIVFDRRSGKIIPLTEHFDHWVEAMAWSRDSRSIYFTAEDKGELPVYRVDADQPAGKPAAVSEVVRGSNDELLVSPDGKTLVFTRMSIEAPNEVYRLALGAKQAENLTHMNDRVFAGVVTHPAESFWFVGAAGVKVQGFIVKPPFFDAGKKYPVKFLIHGGPQQMFGDEWTFRWSAQLFAADGYVVVMINPRGSPGYGQAFIDDINGDWGGKAYEDLMKGLDHAEKTFTYIDKDRECALGASYGGYMVNWILGHSQRFKCLVSHDGIFNTESEWGTTEELWFNEWEFRGLPWTNRELYRKWSPHLFAPNFKTPTLVIHGQLDYRLDLSEGFQLFTTLQRLKVPSKMLYFPDEGHWVLKPQNSRLWYKTVNEWVDSYLKNRPQSPR